MSRGRRRRRVAVRATASVAAVAAIAAGVAAATGFGFASGGGQGGGADGGLPPATATVTRQTLVDTQTESGTLGYGQTATLAARAGGTVTELPATGTTLRRGQAICRIDNLPTVLLYGSLPAYRRLAVGAKGPDVKEFEQNLHALGYRGFTVDETYSAATAAAVKKWQDDLDLPTTGGVDLGRVEYVPGPVRVESQKASLGDAVAPGAEVLDLTGTARVVTVDLDLTDQRLARKGATVHLTLPDGKATTGTIAQVRTVIQPAEGQQDAKTVIEVTATIRDEQAVSGLNDATVDVDFTASQRDNVLTVPVAALLALAEGGYGVQVVTGGTTRIVAVETGLFAAGRVEVTGDGLAEGVTVGVPGD
jgi:peptidoglycan hydrolase-like protein with peptidoglycan-binding domain